jgi:hypothetical protein
VCTSADKKLLIEVLNEKILPAAYANLGKMSSVHAESWAIAVLGDFVVPRANSITSFILKII